MHLNNWNKQLTLAKPLFVCQGTMQTLSEATFVAIMKIYYMPLNRMPQIQYGWFISFTNRSAPVEMVAGGLNPAF